MEFVKPCSCGLVLISRDQILMKMRMFFSCNQKVCSCGYTSMYELLNFLNFRHGLMIHKNAYFACFMNKHNIFEGIYFCCIFYF
jgi:hypothetical protein